MADSNTFDLPTDELPEENTGTATEAPTEGAPKPNKAAKKAAKKPAAKKPASDATPKPKKDDEPERAKSAAELLFTIKKGKVEELKIKDIVRLKDAQTRDGTDEDATLPERVEAFTAAMKEQLRENGEVKWDSPVYVMEIEDGPGEWKGIPTYFLYDGFNTLKAAENAGLKTFKAQVVKGTRAQLIAAAARANVQHDTNGKPRTNADKVRAVRTGAKAFTYSEIPNSEWPSNREFAEMIGVSRNLVNEIDPFSRGKGDQNELKKAKKRKPKAPATPDHADASKFDWGVYDTNLGYIVRGLDSMGDLYGFKDTPEYSAAERLLNEFSAFFANTRKKFGSKKSK